MTKRYMWRSTLFCWTRNDNRASATTPILTAKSCYWNNRNIIKRKQHNPDGTRIHDPSIICGVFYALSYGNVTLSNPWFGISVLAIKMFCLNDKKTHVTIHISYQGFSELASDRLTVCSQTIGNQVWKSCLSDSFDKSDCIFHCFQK